MKQIYQSYTTENQSVWNTLFERQIQNLPGKSCTDYLSCLEKLSPVLNSKSIPNIEKLSAFLHKTCGWQIEIVAGLIPVEDFFELLAQKKFCSSTWLRKPSELDYLEEPDMFHDIFGHIPLFMDENYAEFMHEFGRLGVLHKNKPEIVVQLQRIYWYTIEFGLIKEKGLKRLFGAGIMSSYGESKHIFEKNIEVRPYDLKKIMSTDFKTDEIQAFYYQINSFQELVSDLKALFK